MTMLIEFKGQNDQLELYEDRIIIKRKGIFSKILVGISTKCDKTVYINQITDIDYKKEGRGPRLN